MTGTISHENEDAVDNDAILETENLTKVFGGLTAVDSVDFQLPPDELRCLIGPNGAGKSTFFKMITGRIRPTSGKIFYRGEDITALEPHERAQRGISLKFQQISVFPSLRVRENLRIPVQRFHSDPTARIEDLLETVRLRDFADETVANLSHGQQQWLEIAMSMAIEPTVLLLDEPTAGMTIDETRDTGELIQSLAEEGVSIIVVEHDINFVRQIAEWVTVLHEGRIFTEGTVDEIEANEDVQRIYLGGES